MMASENRTLSFDIASLFSPALKTFCDNLLSCPLLPVIHSPQPLVPDSATHTTLALCFRNLYCLIYSFGPTRPLLHGFLLYSLFHFFS